MEFMDMEQDESKVMILRTKDIVKLANLRLHIPRIGSDQTLIIQAYDYCNHRSSHLVPVDYHQATVVPNVHRLLQKQQDWMFCGDVYTSVEDQSAFHLKLRLSAGAAEESVKLVADLEDCSKRGYEASAVFGFGTVAVDDFIQSIVCKITLLDNNLKTIGDSRCFQLAKQWNGMDERYFYYNDNFCSRSALMEACQVSQARANKKGTNSAFEFIDARIETTIRMKEISQDLMKGSRSSTREFQLKESISKDYPTSKTEVIPERPLNFTEIVVLKAGDGSQKTFYVHKDKLIRESPVFARMLDVSITEKTTGEVILKDCTVEVLEAFIGFLYENVSGSKFEEQVDILLGVLALAHQKGINTIVQRVKELIVSVGNEFLNLELALSIFTAGDLYEMPDLKFRAVQWMKCNEDQLQTAEGKNQVLAVVDTNENLGSPIMAEILAGLEFI